MGEPVNLWEFYTDSDNLQREVRFHWDGASGVRKFMALAESKGSQTMTGKAYDGYLEFELGGYLNVEDPDVPEEHCTVTFIFDQEKAQELNEKEKGRMKKLIKATFQGAMPEYRNNAQAVARRLGISVVF